jgi:hypothetical protein
MISFRKGKRSRKIARDVRFILILMLVLWLGIFMPLGLREAQAGAAPEWAVKVRDLQKLIAEKFVYWWIDHPAVPAHETEGGQVQIGTGEFGGSIGDDVELINGWNVLYLTAHDEYVGESVKWLVDSAWSDGTNWKYTNPRYELLADGFKDSLWGRDAEHASENTSYSTPHMVVMEYGNPRYVENLMDTMEHLVGNSDQWDGWTEVNGSGHRFFKSYMVGTYGTYDPADCKGEFAAAPGETYWDMPETARVVKPGNYLLWFNMSPQLAAQMREYADAWVYAAGKGDGGKPTGVIPGAVVWATEELGSPGQDWRYGDGCLSYDWEQGSWPIEEMYAHMVASEVLFGDESYLYPVETMMTLHFAPENYDGTADPDDLEFAMNNTDFSTIYSDYRILTGQTDFDAYLPGFHTMYGYAEYLATGNKTYIVNSADRLIRLINENETAWTTDPIMKTVDKAKGAYSVFRFLNGVYLGGSGLTRARVPGMAVSWEGTGYDFAALVAQASDTRLKTLVYNFEPEGKNIGVRTWMLEPGTYRVNLGPDANEDDAIDSVTQSFEVDINERGQRIQFWLPAGELHVLQIEQVSSSGDRWTERADLGFAAEDVVLSPADPSPGQSVTAQVTLHNIGSKGAQNIPVKVFAGTSQLPSMELAATGVDRLDAPNDLQPRITQVTMQFVVPDNGEFVISIDPGNQIPESTERNNTVFYDGSRRISPTEIGWTQDESDSTFVDVPFDHPYYDYIEILYQEGYTAGCNTDPLMYCPENIMNRAESAVFVERGIHNADFVPPEPTEVVFEDVALDAWYANWVHGLWEDGYTAGCGTDPLIYCPEQEHTRAEGTVFYLRMMYGADYQPSEVKGYFTDVDPGMWYAKWVDAAYEAGIAEPCAAEPDLRFCPEDPLTRAVAAYMMVNAKGLSLP